MAHVTLGDSPEDLEGSFVKGYEKGFKNGWALGFRHGRREGRREMAAEKDNDSGKVVAKTAEVHQCCRHSPTLNRQKMCLLSDVPVDEGGGNDAQSVADSEDSDLMDIYHDARSHLSSPSASSNTDAHAAPSAKHVGDHAAHPVAGPESSGRNPPKEHHETSGVQGDVTSSPSPGSRVGISSNPVAGGAHSTMPSAPADATSPEKEEDEEDLIWFDAASAHVPDEIPDNHDHDGGIDSATAAPASPVKAVKTTDENGADKTDKAKEEALEEKEEDAAAAPTMLYNIPLPPAVRPATPPDLSVSPRARRGPRPAYPVLRGALDAYALRARGARVAENPWRVLVGPLSPAARAAWRHDAGRGYLRSRLETGRRGGGGGASGPGSWGVGGWGPRADDSGLVFCDMVCDVDGVWYVLATFDRQDRASRAIEVFTGYACGGSIMWAWLFQEEE
ncbi:hypothetical protein VTH06DRAFT_7384 [Thermothelomyces fergusii]